MGKGIDRNFVLVVGLVLVVALFFGEFGNSLTGNFLSFNFLNFDENKDDDMDDKLDAFFEGYDPPGPVGYWEGWYKFTDYLLYKPGVWDNPGWGTGDTTVSPPKWNTPIMIYIRDNLIEMSGPYYGDDNRHNYDGKFENLNYFAYGSFIEGSGAEDGSGAAPWSSYDGYLPMLDTVADLKNAKLESAKNNNNYKILANKLDYYKKEYANAYQRWAKYHGKTDATTRYDIPILCNGGNKITKDELKANGQTWACVDNCPMGYYCADTENCDGNCGEGDGMGPITPTPSNVPTKPLDGPATGVRPGPGTGGGESAYCQPSGLPNTKQDGSGDDINNYNQDDYTCVPNMNCPGDKDCLMTTCKCPIVGDPPVTH